MASAWDVFGIAFAGLYFYTLPTFPYSQEERCQIGNGGALFEKVSAAFIHVKLMA